MDLGKMTGGLFDSGDSLETFSTLSPQQSVISKKLREYMTDRIGKGLPTYEGERVAPMSTQEQAGLGALNQYQSGYGAYMPQQQGVFAKALAGNALPQIDSSGASQYFENNIAPIFQRRFQEFMAPAMEQTRAMGGRKSSSAMNQTVATQAAGLGDQLSQMQYQYLQQEQAAQRQREELNAQYQVGAMQSTDPLRAEQLRVAASGESGLAQLPRMLEQAGMDAAFQEFMRTLPEMNPVLAQAMQYIGIPMQGTYMQSNPGLVSQVSNGMGQLADLVGNTQAISGGQGSLQTQNSGSGGGGGGGGGGTGNMYAKAFAALMGGGG